MENASDANAISNIHCSKEASLSDTTVETEQDNVLLFEELKPYKLFISDIIY